MLENHSINKHQERYSLNITKDLKKSNDELINFIELNTLHPRYKKHNKRLRIIRLRKLRLFRRKKSGVHRHKSTIYKKIKDNFIQLDGSILRNYIKILSYKINNLISDLKKIQEFKTEIIKFNQNIYLLRILSNDKNLKDELNTKLSLNLKEKIAFFKSKGGSDINYIKFNSIFTNLVKKLEELKADINKISDEKELKNAFKILKDNLKLSKTLIELFNKIFNNKQNLNKALTEENKANLFKIVQETKVTTADSGKNGKLKKLKNVRNKKANNIKNKHRNKKLKDNNI